MNDLKNMMEESSLLSLRQAASNPSFSATTAGIMLIIDAIPKFFRVTQVPPVTETHKKQRCQFCEWILEQELRKKIFVHRLIWTEEKFFMLVRKPHRKNDWKWSASDPHEIMEINNCNGDKVMIKKNRFCMHSSMKRAVQFP